MAGHVTSGLLAAVRHERSRHLNFEELEALVEAGGNRPTDPLLDRHLNECATCRAEFEDLRGFEARYDTVVALPSAPHAARGRWRRSLALAGIPVLAIMAALVIVYVGRLGTDPIAVVPKLAIRLATTDPGRGQAASALQGRDTNRLSAETLRTLAEARRLAQHTGQEQTVRFRLTPGEIAALRAEASALGRIEEDTAGPVSTLVDGPARDVEVTLRPGATGVETQPEAPRERR